jgi:4-hydroxyproline epimerase
MTSTTHRIAILDSHTAGEPTRLVLSGGPDLGSGPLPHRLELFRTHHDHLRSAIVNEPRGSDVLVGALLLEPHDPTCAAAVLFFNNVGTIGMCGHGTIGLIASLAHLGRIAPGTHRIETPVGTVTATLHPSGSVTVQNVPAYRYATGVAVEVPGHGTVTGDVAWGGNWFFLVEDDHHALTLQNAEALTAYTWAIRQALPAAGITGANNAEIDHIELFSHPSDATADSTNSADSTNFVLCPGKSYDRSPCGTGTSAKLACLHADARLAPGQPWRQRGILGGIFEGTYTLDPALPPGHILPSITGSAYVTSEGTLLLDPNDPFRDGIHP